MYEITMPKLSDSMKEGKIIEWKVKEGDRVTEGDILAEVESDKATMELECFRAGTIKKIVRANDAEVVVGEVIGIIEEEGEAPTPKEAREEASLAEAPGEAVAGARESAAKKEKEERLTEEAPREGERKPAEKPPEPKAPPAEAQAPAPAPRPEEGEARGEERYPVSPYARRLAQEKGVDLNAVKGTGPGGRITARDIEAAQGQKPQPAPAKEEKQLPETKAAAEVDNVDPLAKTIAQKRGIDLSAIKGTGTQGRITADDVKAARVTKTPPAAAEEELPPLELREGEADVEDASYRHKTQARIVTASKRAIPHFYITDSVNVSALMAAKDDLKKRLGATITHIIVLACLKALRQHPEINRSYDHGRIIKWKGIHLGLAIDTPEGLTVAVVHNAQDYSPKKLMETAGALVEKARNGKLSADERRHPTFTISSLGMFDIEQFAAIINPPSSVTLAVAAALRVPVVNGNLVEVGHVMKLTMSCDHRIIDGAMAARFMKDLKQILQNVGELVQE